jgi:hypothetical protein
MHREIFHVGVTQETKQQAQYAHHQSGEKNLMAGEPEEISLIEIGEPEIHLTTWAVLGAGHSLR